MHNSKMVIDTRGKFPDTHVTNYNYLILHQYHLKIDGLWRLNNRYFILCPELDNSTLAIDGSNLNKWFRDHSILGTQTQLVNSIPEGAERIPTFTKDDVSYFAGSPRNFTFFLNDLLSNLPKDFPDFRLQDNNTGTLKFLTLQPLTENQELILSEAIEKMRTSIRLETDISDNLDDINQPLLNEEMVFRHNRTFKGLAGTNAKKIWEQDEDFWNDKRANLLNASARKSEFFPENFSIKESSCIISDSITPPNIRNFLTLYGVVYLNLPILQFHDQYWKSLGITEEELMTLLELKRVKLLVTQALHRYHPRILEILSELNESSYLLPRRLASITISDLRNRNPILFPTFDDEVKYELLHQLHHKNILSKLPKGLDQTILSSVASMWDNYFEDVHRLGTHALRNYSSYYFLDAIFKSRGKDIGLELMDSIPSVDFAAALQSNVIPKYRESYTDETIMTTIANLYSGVPNNMIPKNFPYSNTSVDRVLVISKDVPVNELAKTFTNHDIDRFRKLIFGLTEHKRDQTELDSALKLFNEHVINYEKSKSRLNTMDVSGFLIDGGLALTGTNIPLASWIIDKSEKFLTQLGVTSGTVQKLVDELNAMKTGTALPNAVLVARMRNQLKENWFKHKMRQMGL